MPNDKWRRILVQAFFWLAIQSLTVLIVARPEVRMGPWGRHIPIWFLQILLVFTNVYWLFPKFFPGKKWIYCLNGLILVTALSFSVLPMWEWLDLPGMRPGRMRGRGGPPNPFGDLLMVFLSLSLAFVFSLVIELYIRSESREREFLRLAKENMQTELQLLKSQINPHFLFNALNNIYTLSLIGSEKTPENIGRLSDLLRYVLYDCDKDTVPLEKEIRYIEDYLSLYQLKKEDGLNIKVDLEQVNGHHEIPPMLLMPFVENALKHSYIEHRDGWLDIDLQTGKNELCFRVSNSVMPDQKSKDAVGGIGLQNVRRRLDLLFPGRHQLAVSNKADRFDVELKLEMHAEN